MAAPLTRRSFLRRSAIAGGALALGPAFWQRALASATTVGEGPYGPLGPPDANGVRLPAGFRARVIARGAELVPGTTYPFPIQPDGQTTFATRDGGWILVTNSESAPPLAGVSAIRFDARGRIVDAYRILGGTVLNCAGGRTPWGTWLSCEEYDESDLGVPGLLPGDLPLGDGVGRGAVWECDPTRPSQGVRLPALGLFKHEAACVDPVDQRLYLTEDHGDGLLYRFTPDDYPVLDSGLLEAAVVAPGGSVSWREVPDPTAGPLQPPTRAQVPGATRFRRAEGIWFDSGIVYVATTADERIHAYDTVRRRIDVVYDRARTPGSPITDPDNITVSPSGDLFICENPPAEAGSLEVGLLTPDLTISPFMRFEGPKHVYDAAALGPSELAGAVFDPSGTRLYVSSQRARHKLPYGDLPGEGEVYEVAGPFRLERPRGGPLSPGNPRAAGQAIGPGQARHGEHVGAALGVELPRRMRLATLLRRGVPLALTLDEPATVDVTLHARFRPARAGRVRRGAAGAATRARRRRVVLARARRTYRAAGARRAWVRLRPRARRLLAGRRRNLRVTARVTITGRGGDRERFERAVLAKPARRRRS